MKGILLIGLALSLHAQVSLDNFTAHQIIERSRAGEVVDCVEMDVSTIRGKEVYEKVRIDDRPSDMATAEKTGWMSYGDFSSVLQWTKDLKTGSYNYPKSQRVYYIQDKGKKLYPELEVVIERDFGGPGKGSMVSVSTHPIGSVGIVMFSFYTSKTKVAGKEYDLPTGAILRSEGVNPDGRIVLYKNSIKFTDYRRFGATSDLVF